MIESHTKSSNLIYSWCCTKLHNFVSSSSCEWEFFVMWMNICRPRKKNLSQKNIFINLEKYINFFCTTIFISCTRFVIIFLNWPLETYFFFVVYWGCPFVCPRAPSWRYCGHCWRRSWQATRRWCWPFSSLKPERVGWTSSSCNLR